MATETHLTLTEHDGAKILIAETDPMQVPNLVEGCKTLITTINSIDSAPTVIRMYATQSYGWKENAKGYHISLKPQAKLCTEATERDVFLGVMAALPVRMADVRRRFPGQDGAKFSESITAQLRWASRVDAHNAPTPVATNGEVFFDTENPQYPWSTPDYTVRERSQWIEELDKKGFIGLYQLKDRGVEGVSAAAAADTDALLVVCCRSTPASRWYRDFINGFTKSPALDCPRTYADIVSSKLYECVKSLCDRNARRLLYNAAAALGVAPTCYETDSAAASRPDGWTPTKPADGTRRALLAAMAERPLMALPTIYNMLDVFCPSVSSTGELESVDFFNAISPTDTTNSTPFHIKICGEDVKTAGISLVNTHPELLFFDGRVNGGAACDCQYAPVAILSPPRQ